MFDAHPDTSFNPFMIHPKQATKPVFPVRIWHLIQRVAAAINRRRKVWITIDRLRRLDDKTLRDIGVERDQIETAVQARSVRW